ncbi:bifunctional diaminohydroxyphosphoribosylaminopyrimidine deaminase/5-amino-6-(5-phosphoribosylamino)uracil reductase RibD [Candidatus Saganbacteria bacterium]|nr:bifunctional diaminohydroxyphosphoribosylaminopyrimidine deaminase/5-amino-6-(5-phosphoribosylamino)uracil reductase RibD [Candidatus Saganbacteria bacterium]
MWTEDDIKFMSEAISLAKSMEGRTSPDPMVGSVIVKDGKIISSGYHAEVTTPHAEAWAIKKAQEKNEAQGATLYVNLEPCCFFEEKNNPPCTQSIIKSGIKTVIAAMQDPNPSVAGRGFADLREAGVEVKVGLLEDEAKKINEVFIKHITTGRPYVILKAAMSMDGKIATRTGDSFWITGIESRIRGHHLRNIVDAILVGINTVIKDDPELTVREIAGKIKNPIKIILDPRARIPLNSKVLKIEPENTILVVSDNAPKAKLQKILKTKAEVLKIKTKKGLLDLDHLTKELGKRKIASILIEGGGLTNAHALSSGIVDKVNFFVSPKIIGGEKAKTPIEGLGIDKLSRAIKLKDLTCERVGEDLMLEGYIIR